MFFPPELKWDLIRHMLDGLELGNDMVPPYYRRSKAAALLRLLTENGFIAKDDPELRTFLHHRLMEIGEKIFFEVAKKKVPACQAVFGYWLRQGGYEGLFPRHSRTLLDLGPIGYTVRDYEAMAEGLSEKILEQILAPYTEPPMPETTGGDPTLCCEGGPV